MSLYIQIKHKYILTCSMFENCPEQDKTVATKLVTLYSLTNDCKLAHYLVLLYTTVFRIKALQSPIS